MKTLEEQRRILLENAADVIPEDEFDRRLADSVSSGTPLRVKLGVDPGAEHVTLGWAVVLRKLREFQDCGHIAVLIVGDFTAQVGDPSGKSETRKPLSPEEVEANAQAVLVQFGRILSDDRLEIRRNSEWLGAMGMADVLRLAGHYTVARMLERDDFSKRFKSQTPISMMEFMYPLLQGYDSIAVKADIELGGTDQTFNNLVGRALQGRYDQKPQMVLTMPLLVGTDGSRVMGQSFGNYIGITEEPAEMFGKVMSVADEAMLDYYRLATDIPASQVEQIKGGLESGNLHPVEAKRRLAHEIVRLYHSEEAADEARDRFDQVHKEREIPADVPTSEVPADLVKEGKVWLPKLLVALGLAASNSEGRRLVQQGGVRLDGEQLSSDEAPLEALKGHVLQVGSRKMIRLS